MLDAIGQEIFPDAQIVIAEKQYRKGLVQTRGQVVGITAKRVKYSQANPPPNALPYYSYAKPHAVVVIGELLP